METEIRILHTSDLHLDASFRAAGIASARARERCAAHLEAFDRVVAEAARVDAHLLLIAGDLFEAAHTRPSTVRHVARQLEKWGRPVFVAPGNHDPIRDDSVYALADWPANVTLFRGTWEARALPQLGLVVHGRGFTEPEEHGRLLQGLLLEGVGQHIVVAHGSDESSRPDRHQPYRPFTTADIDEVPAAYVALGHFHRFAELPTQRVRAVYCGSPIPQGFQDTGTHGVVLARLQDDRVEVELRSLPARRFVALRFDVTASETHAEVVERVSAAMEEHTLQEDFVRVHLEGALPPDLEVDRARLRDELGARAHHIEVYDETFPEYDLDALAQEGTVRGQFVRTLCARMEALEGSERDTIQRAIFLGLDAFAGRPQRR
jgi:DNA repair exonuclease SbcCD nuclease subunit